MFTIRCFRSSHRDSFRKCLQPFYNFPGGSICSSNRHEFSRRVHLFVEKTCFFQEGLSVRRADLIISSNRYYFSQKPLFNPRTHTNFPGASIFSSNYLVLKHIRFSRRPYLVLEHIQFSRRPLCLEHIGIFQKDTPSRTDILLIGLGGCFRCLFHSFS